MAKFNKGDWVEVTNPDSSSLSEGMNIGDIFEVRSIWQNSQGYLVSIGKTTGLYFTEVEITDKAIAAKIAHLLKHGDG